jgi:hypothetical protein
VAQSGTQTIATFTGTLLRREHQIGQKFVQLIFREGDKNWLCVSTNTMLTKLDVGQKYHIQGMFKSRSGCDYIHEPRVTAVHPRFFRLRHWALRTVIVLLVATATAFAVRLVHGNLAPTSAESQGTHKPAAQTTSDTTTQQPVTPVAEVTPTPTPAAATPPATTKPKTVTPKTSTNPVVTSLAPHCDGIVVTTPAPVITQDSTQLTTYENITQQSIDRQVQTCYPDAGTANGTTKVLVEGQPLMETVGTAPPSNPDVPNP